MVLQKCHSFNIETVELRAFFTVQDMEDNSVRKEGGGHVN